MDTLLTPFPVFTLAFLLRLFLLLYGHYQDTHSPLKYTDIDYFVFTDAARAVAHGGSPYARATYRYTPLLAWLLRPTTRWFDFGKALFALADLAAGALHRRILTRAGVAPRRALAFAALWLLNPMVAQISTRGSSEGLVVLGVLACVAAVLEGRCVLGGLLLGGVAHLKVYPALYGAAVVVWFSRRGGAAGWVGWAKGMVTKEAVAVGVSAAAAFVGLGVWMFVLYVLRLGQQGDLDGY